MREVSTQRQPQLVHRDRAAKFHGQRGVRVAVDAPALVGPCAVGIVLINAVHGIARGKDSLAARFHIGGCVRVKPVAAVAVVGVEPEVPPRGDFLRRGKAGAQQMAGADKAAWAVIYTVIGGRDREIQPALPDVYERRGHRILELHHTVQTRLVALQRDPIAVRVGGCMHKRDALPRAADGQRVPRCTDDFQLDFCHASHLLLCQQCRADDTRPVAERAGRDAGMLFGKGTAKHHRRCGGTQRL